MGQCEVCSKQGDFNALDTNDLMEHLQQTGLADQITQLRNDNREYLSQYKFSPMPDRSFYRGKIVNLLREGYGELYSDDFNYYGFFKNDLPHGQGALITEKQCYRGQFAAGMMHGEGKEWSKDFCFDGNYKNGIRVRGKLQREEFTYIGDLSEDKFEGEGKLTLKDGTIYEGHFRQGQLEGKGKINYSSGNSYNGSFKAGKYHGYGQFTWNNGSSYRGCYEKGKRHGYGVLKIDETQFSGYWKDGLREGQGRFSKAQDFAFGQWTSNGLFEHH